LKHWICAAHWLAALVQTLTSPEPKAKATSRQPFQTADHNHKKSRQFQAELGG
jgi:hypothetical protein